MKALILTATLLASISAFAKVTCPGTSKNEIDYYSKKALAIEQVIHQDSHLIKDDAADTGFGITRTELKKGSTSCALVVVVNFMYPQTALQQKISFFADETISIAPEQILDID